MATNPTTLTGQQAPQGETPQPQLSEALQKTVWNLLMELERADEIPRRFEVRQILKRRLYFRGDQYWFWNEDMGCWLPPEQAPVGMYDDYEQPAFQHVTNIFQAYSVSLCSVLSQNNTAARFWPEDPSDNEDVQTAKSASKVIDLIQRQNDWQNLIDEATYFMCTDGFIGSYSRYVSDGERFGNDEQDVYGPLEVPLGPSHVTCLACGYEAEGSIETEPSCPECGEPLADVPAPTTTVPQMLGTVKIPKGREVISIVPALQLRRTMYADHQDEFMYLDWVTDLHKSIAMATYPDAADKINASAGGDAETSTSATYERIARRLLYLGTGRHVGMALTDLGTFHRAWIRPKSFYGITGHSDTEQTPCDRCQLLQMYPEGIHVVYFNDIFCEARAEGMNEKWETMHTMQGEGQIRETLVSSIEPVQEQFNDAINLLFEICMFGVPEGFADTDLINFEARNNTSAQAGNLTPTKKGLGPNEDIRGRIMFTPATEPSMAMMKYIEMLFNAIPQFLCGAFPALFGGDTGANDTMGGIAMMRNQALGRIGRAWRRLQLFSANTSGKAVKCFAKNRSEDVNVAKLGASGDYETDTIRLEDLQGNVVAYPEVDAQYPTLEADIRSLIMTLWNGANPLFLATAQVPKNLETIFRYMGLKGIEVPGEAQRKKTYKDIQQLIQEQPQQGEPIPEQPPTPENPQGSPAQPGPMMPSVMPDPNVDDLSVASETAKSWLISDAGLQVRDQSPPGYDNVKLFSKACEQFAKLQQFQQGLAAQALAGQGPAADLGGAAEMGPHPNEAPPPGTGANGSPPQKGAAPGQKGE